MTSILTCRFMLALRQFDNTVAAATRSGLGPQLREHVESAVLQFGAQPSDSLPELVASFSYPIHLDTSLLDENVEDGGRSTTAELTLDQMPTAPQSPVQEQIETFGLEDFAGAVSGHFRF